MKSILLGYEIKTGSPVSIPLHHLVCCGVTSLSGKTTTLEALVQRSGMRAIAFRTKRGESGFEDARTHRPYFHERSDWQYVQGLLEATMRERMKFERSWIIKSTKGTKSLREVYENIVARLESGKMRSLDESVYTNLKAYLEIVLPEIEKGDFADELTLGEGVTVMDLEGMSDEMQSLVIASTLNAVYEKERDMIVVIPEAWKFAPESRGNPVKREAEKLIRQGASIRLFLWFDSQDIAGVDKSLLKQVDNWILGRQREINEVEHTLAQVPIPRKQRPKPEEIMQLKVGHFFACFDDEVRKVYVRPVWLSEADAILVAKGAKPIPKPMKIPKKPEVDMDAQERKLYEAEITSLKADLKIAEESAADYERFWKRLKAEKARGRGSGDGLPEPRRDAEGRAEPSLAAAKPALQLGPIDLEAVERVVTVSHSEELREFKTTNPGGRIMYVLLKDLGGKDATEGDIADAMRERGWNYGHSTMAPELSKLKGNGDIISDNGRPAHYRIPGKLKIEVRP
jgi:hypothetical protein